MTSPSLNVHYEGTGGYFELYLSQETDFEGSNKVKNNDTWYSMQ